MRILACIVLLGLFTRSWGETIDFPNEGYTANGNAHARLVRLTSNIHYENRNSNDIVEVIHRVTVPATGAEYQVLLQVETDGQHVKLEKHKNSEDGYIAVSFPLRAKESIDKHVSFLLLLSAVDYSKRLSLVFPKQMPDAIRAYLKPDRQSPSDNKDIVDLAALLGLKCADDLCKIHHAYEFPARHLHFEIQNDLAEGFAKKSAATIVYKHGDSWTWSNSYSGTAHDFDADLVDVSMLWTLSVVREGSKAEIDSTVLSEIRH